MTKFIPSGVKMEQLVQKLKFNTRRYALAHTHTHTYTHTYTYTYIHTHIMLELKFNIFLLKKDRNLNVHFLPYSKNTYSRSLGGSSPLCAITVSQLIRWVSQNTTKLY